MSRRLAQPQGAARPLALPAVLAVLLLAGCGALPTPPVTAEPPRAALGLGAHDAFAAADRPQPTADDLRWWRRFDDPGLSAWVEQALARAPDLAAADARVDQARALLAQAQAQRGPRLGAQAEATLDARRSAGQRTLQPRAALSGSWDPDVWGALQAGEAAALAGLQRSQALAQAARLAHAALTAQAYLEWRAALAEGRTLDQALALQREVARTVGVRFDAGLAPRLDVDRAAAEVATLQADAAAVGARQRQARAALALLGGQVAGLARDGWDPDAAPGNPDPTADPNAHPTTPVSPPLPTLQGTAPLARPLDLLRLRPDLQAAEAALREAAAQAGVAQAALRPALRLDGRLLLATAGGGGALELASASVGALLDAVLFDGGARRAAADAAQARAVEAAELWRATALRALQQVEVALAAAEASAQRVAALQRALQAREQAVAQAQTLYTAGLAGFLDLLEAQRSALAARRALLQAQADAALAAVAQFQALGLVPPAMDSGPG